MWRSKGWGGRQLLRKRQRKCWSISWRKLCLQNKKWLITRVSALVYISLLSTHRRRYCINGTGRSLLSWLLGCSLIRISCCCRGSAMTLSARTSFRIRTWPIAKTASRISSTWISTNLLKLGRKTDKTNGRNKTWPIPISLSLRPRDWWKSKKLPAHTVWTSQKPPNPSKTLCTRSRKRKGHSPPKESASKKDFP